jgi:Protein of unknown function (DUF2569).
METNANLVKFRKIGGWLLVEMVFICIIGALMELNSLSGISESIKVISAFSSFGGAFAAVSYGGIFISLILRGTHLYGILKRNNKLALRSMQGVYVLTFVVGLLMAFLLSAFYNWLGVAESAFDGRFFGTLIGAVLGFCILTQYYKTSKRVRVYYLSDEEYNEELNGSPE